MSLMGTLAKVAIGVAMAKGAQSVIAKKGGASGGGGGGGGAFGGTYSPGNSTSQDRDVLGDLLGGGSGGSGGGLGGLLEGLSDLSGGGNKSTFDDVVHKPSQSGSGGGLEDLIGSLTGGQSGGAGGALGGLLGTLAGAAGSKGGFGELLNQSLQTRGEPKAQPSREQDAAAGLMLRAMIQAAKSDGKIDDAERQKLLDNLGDVSPEERDFVNREMSAPVDPEGLARQVPNGMQQQVYAMSLLGIDLDNRNEAQYLHSLATAMGIDKSTVNQIHGRFGAPAIY